MIFLSKSYDQATEQLVLIDTMSKSVVSSKKKKVVNTNAVNVQNTTGNSNIDDKDEIELRKKKEKRKKQKEEIGPCPNCNLEHTYMRRDKMSFMA